MKQVAITLSDEFRDDESMHASQESDCAKAQRRKEKSGRCSRQMCISGLALCRLMAAEPRAGLARVTRSSDMAHRQVSPPCT